jgi:diguanylate cyclase (GGDEF)-like protein
LTGLPNRLFFNDRLQEAFEQLDAGSELAILFIDLDRFKLVNDSLGHDAGDLLLEEVGKRFQACLGASATLARFGGDEFTVLLSVATVNEATEVGERLVETLHRPFRIAGREVFPTASIGLALSSQTRRTPGDLLRAADTALYQAKGAGRAAIALYEPGMSVESHDSLMLEAELRHAKDRNEFLLYFQPIVDLESGRISALEALLRWNHPTRGVLAPKDFIDLAEETELIVPIGRWAIEESCRLLQSWSLPDEMRVNVNLGARQLHAPELAGDIRRALETSGLRPGRLQLEISEQLLVEELRATAGTLRELRMLGVRLAIDDFGAGASSLASLRDLPVDLLKLDQSFISPAGGMADEAIVTGITALAHTLGLRVAAEGVENSHQLAVIRLAGCDEGQGFLFGRPVSSERVPSLFHQYAHPIRFPEILAHPHPREIVSD